MQLDFAEPVERRFEERRSIKHGTPSISDQCVVVTVRAAKIEEVAPCGGFSMHEGPGEIIEPDMNVESDEKDWSLEGIMTPEEAVGSGLRGRMRSL